MKSRHCRYLFTCVVIAFLYFMQERPLPSSNEPIKLYASVCHDDLHKVTLQAISEARNSIYLVMYSLSDSRIIQALNQKTCEGVALTVIHDASTPQKGYKALNSADRTPLKMGGLMHQKLLIIDQETAWIGSANFTTESLRLHDNLIASFASPELCRTLESTCPNSLFHIGNQTVEFVNLPEAKKEGLTKLVQLINGAGKSLQIAMYTWTHPELTTAVIEAHERGIQVEVILDRGQASGAGRKTKTQLVEAGIPVWLSSGQKLLHHKCMLIDNEILVNGSTNWTRAAFSRNKDCFFILRPLSGQQKKKLKLFWKRTRALSRREAPLETLPLAA